MDIRYINDKFQFSLRTSSVIFNKEHTKILLFNVNGRDTYLLPGGKVREGETTVEAINREINEELGYDGLDYHFLALSEEFIKNKTDNHQINVIYYTTLSFPIQKEKFSGLEGEWCNFEWVNIEDLSKYKINPKQIINCIKDINKTYHIVTK